MARTPPSSGRFSYNEPVPVYAFEKNEGSISSTFVGRIIYRVPIRLVLRTGDLIEAVRYAGRYWPIYRPETFPEKTREWIKPGDIIFGENHTRLQLPLNQAYLFECDAPRGHYRC